MKISSLLLAFLIVFSVNSNADIVKWTDEDGKVHFGDRVPEKYQEKSETVEVESKNFVNNDNKPKGNYWEKQRRKKQFEQEQDRMYQQKQAQQQRKLNVYCKKAEAHYKDISTFNHHGDGSYDVKVIVDENGKAISRREQDRLAERYRAEANGRGCNIQQSEGLRL
ncbi:hypothetical protein TDB9533_04258 [Thalassocella blandensis]|nr:hypothetical protein TDB9533_04258 [Thalassocella blandensis]